MVVGLGTQFPIHEDTDSNNNDCASDIEEGDVQSVDYVADESEEDEVEPAVAEDMEKFESTFTGIGNRYRLINRIGEGMLVSSRTTVLCVDSRTVLTFA